MDKRPRVEGRIANFGIILDILSFGVLADFLLFFKKIGFLGILGPPYCVIQDTICIGREMLCLSSMWDFYYQDRGTEGGDLLNI